MRYSKQIGELTSKAKDIEFPVKQYTKADQSRDWFTDKLCDLLYHNFRVLRRDIAYNESNGTFYWSATETIGVHDSRVWLSLESRYYVDPKKDLEEEFARVVGEIESNRQLRVEYGKFMVSIGGDWR